jgi:DNA-binding transcriptional LysR family regulator
MIDALECFLAVVDSGNLSRAAAVLELAVSSVSRKIDSLEAELGVKLLHRSSRLILLTDAGEQFLPRARNILAELAEGKAAVLALDHEPRGLLTVTAPAAFGRLHVGPAVAAFLQRYPLLEVDLHVSDDIVDLMARRVDVAVRAGHLPDSDLVATRLATQYRVVSASPAYLARCGWPAAPLDLLNHNCLTVAGRSVPSDWWTFEGVNRNQPLPVKGTLRSDDTDTLLHAAMAGLGLVHLANWLVSDAIVAGQLVPLFASPLRSRPEPGSRSAPGRREITPSGIHAVRMPGRSNQAKAQLLINHLREYFGEPAYWDVALERAGRNK